MSRTAYIRGIASALAACSGIKLAQAATDSLAPGVAGRVTEAVRGRIGQEPYNQLNRLVDDVAHFETRNRNIPNNQGGNASGYYQTQDDSLVTMRNHLDQIAPGNALSRAMRSKGISRAIQLPRKDQTTLLKAHLDRSAHTRLADGIANTADVYGTHPAARHPFDVWRDAHWIGPDKDVGKKLLRWYQNFPDTPDKARHLRALGTEGRRDVFRRRGSHIGAVTGSRPAGGTAQAVDGR